MVGWYKEPEDGKPKSFSGAVGKFDLSFNLNKNELKLSESFQASVKISGKGNLKLFKPPKLIVPPNLEVYEPEYVEKVKTNLSGMSGSISEVYTIVPQIGVNFQFQFLISHILIQKKKNTFL